MTIGALRTMYVKKVKPVWRNEKLPDLDQGARGLIDVIIRVGGQGPAEEGGAKVDGDWGEPDHEEAEGDALGVVSHHLQCLQVPVLDVRGQHWAGVQDRGEEVHLNQQQVSSAAVWAGAQGCYEWIILQLLEYFQSLEQTISPECAALWREDLTLNIKQECDTHFRIPHSTARVFSTSIYLAHSLVPSQGQGQLLTGYLVVLELWTNRQFCVKLADGRLGGHSSIHSIAMSCLDVTVLTVTRSRNVVSTREHLLREVFKKNKCEKFPLTFHR